MIMSLDPAFRNLGVVVYTPQGQPIYATTLKTTKAQYKKTSRYVSGQDLNALTYSLTELKKIIDKYKVNTIYCELSTAGGKSASAVKGLAYSFCFIVAPVVFKGMSLKHCTPTDVKKFVYKKTSGEKDGIMDFVVKLYGLETKGTKTKFCGQWFGKGLFEHIADAVIVYQILREE